MTAVNLDLSLNDISGNEGSRNLSDSDYHRQVIEWNQTARDYPRDKCVHQLFEEQAERTRDAIAVVFEDQSLTYAELNARANQLAHHLQTLGVGPEVLVGLCVDRSLDMIVGLLGILKAGGAYLPLDPKLPDARLRFMISDARLATILTARIHGPLVERVLTELTTGFSSGDRDFLPHTCSVILIEDMRFDSPVPSPPRSGEKVAGGRMRGFDCAPTREPLAFSPEFSDFPVNAAHPAYVNYTSGSTGEPRGVLVPHRAVVRLVKSTNYVSLDADDTLLQLSTLSFDASTFEIWGALLNGGRLVLMPPNQPSLTEIGDAIRRYHVTTLWLTAGLFHLMVDERIEDLRPLRQLLAGGDVLSVDHVIRARRALPDCRIINGYGPTENTTFTCCYTVGDEADLSPSVPIGRPISNTQVYLLNSSLQPVPVGVAGELYTGGDGLACGYLNAPGLTDEKFIANPFSDEPNSRLYRTGDMARYRPDGNIEFLGRTDLQVKIRGFRIELGQVEAAMRAMPAIRDAVVLAQEFATGDRQLVAYLVFADDREQLASDQERPRRVFSAELRSQLSNTLPDFMIPSRFVVLPSFPLTPNGKLDRKALLNVPGFELATGTAHQSPRNELERQMACIWQTVLKREQIGIDDNFFELGGHSLLAVLISSRMAHDFGFDIPLRSLFEHPTIAQLAQQLQTLAAGDSSSSPVERVSRVLPLPTSFAQQRMWLLQQMLPDPATYHVPVAWRLTGHVDAKRIQQCLLQLMSRHEVLRTSFAYLEEQLTQKIMPAVDCVLPWQPIDLRAPSSGLRPPSPPTTGEKGHDNDDPLAPAGGEGQGERA